MIKPLPEDAPQTGAFYTPGQYTPDQSVGYLMRKVLSSILSQADTQLAPHDVTSFWEQRPKAWRCCVNWKSTQPATALTG